MEKLAKFEDPINSIIDLIEYKNWHLESIWPKLKKSIRQWSKWKGLILLKHLWIQELFITKINTIIKIEGDI
jgi:hypothetical protein